jgi:glycosyltransferase involved in cell wall biosynthesis
MKDQPKIKIAVISETTTGGARKHLIDLLLGLNKNRYDLYFIFSKKRADETFLNYLTVLKKENINLIEIPMEREISPAADIKSFFSLYRQLKKIKPDIVHVHAAKAGAIGIMAAILTGNRKIIYNPHGGIFHRFENKFGFVYLIFEKFLSRKYVHFIGVSKYSCELFEKKLNIKPSNNHLIYNGISAEINPINIQDQIKLKMDLNIKEDDFVILFPANFYSEKGHIEFLNSYELLDGSLNLKIKLIFAGEGPLEKIIEEKVDSLKLDNSIIFSGFIKDIEKYFSISDIVILPSQKEFLPYAVLEAMLFSKPVFASDTGAVNEMIKDNYNGKLFSPKKLVELWKSLNYFSIHKDELEKMGSNGRKYVEQNFSLSLMISKTELLYETIYSNSK